MIKQAKELAYVLCNIDSDHLGAKEDRKKRETEEDYQRKKKSEQKQMKEYDYRSKVIGICEVLVHSVRLFGMDHINNLKVKDIMVLFCYNLGSEI